MNLIKALEAHRKRLGLKKSDLARLFSVEPQNYNNWVYRGRLPLEMHQAAAAILDSNSTAAIRGNASPFFIPLIDWRDVHLWCHDGEDDPRIESWLPVPAKAGKRAFALRVAGDAMISPQPGQRSYFPDTILFVDPDLTPSPGRRVIALVEQNATFKTLAEDAGRKFLVPLNPVYERIDLLKPSDICGVVFGSYTPE